MKKYIPFGEKAEKHQVFHGNATLPETETDVFDKLMSENTLTQLQAHAIFLKVACGLTCFDIAKLLGKTQPAITYRIDRGMKKLYGKSKRLYRIR